MRGASACAAASTAALTLALWWGVVTVSGAPSYLLPSPGEVLARMVSDAPLLLRHGWQTARILLLGFCSATGLGLILGAAIAHLPALDRALTPLLAVLHAIPKLVFMPLLLLWFGYGPAPGVIVVVLMAILPAMSGMLTGLRLTDPGGVALLLTMGASPWQIFWRLRLPQAAPGILVGLKVAMAAATLGAVVTEFVASDGGLGLLIVTATAHLDTPLLFAAVGAVAILAALGHGLVESLSRLIDGSARRAAARSRRLAQRCGA